MMNLIILVIMAVCAKGMNRRSGHCQPLDGDYKENDDEHKIDKTVQLAR